MLSEILGLPSGEEEKQVNREGVIQMHAELIVAKARTTKNDDSDHVRAERASMIGMIYEAMEAEGVSREEAEEIVNGRLEGYWTDDLKAHQNRKGGYWMHCPNPIENDLLRETQKVRQGYLGGRPILDEGQLMEVVRVQQRSKGILSDRRVVNFLKWAGIEMSQYEWGEVKDSLEREDLERWKSEKRYIRVEDLSEDPVIKADLERFMEIWGRVDEDSENELWAIIKRVEGAVDVNELTQLAMKQKRPRRG